MSKFWNKEYSNISNFKNFLNKIDNNYIFFDEDELKIYKWNYIFLKK